MRDVEQIRYNDASYLKANRADHIAFLTQKQERKLRAAIDFVAEHGYTYRDHMSFVGSLCFLAAEITGPDGNAHDFGFRSRWIETIWSGMILHRIAMIEHKYDEPDRHWGPGRPGYPGFDNYYYDVWLTDERRRLDREERGVTA